MLLCQIKMPKNAMLLRMGLRRLQTIMYFLDNFIPMFFDRAFVFYQMT